MIAAPGLYNIPLEEYVADPCVDPSLSSRVAHELLTRSPLHARELHPRLNPHYRPDTSGAAELGTIAHRIVLERSWRDIVVVNAPDYRTKAARQVRDDARANGKTPILAEPYKALEAMVTAWKPQFAALDPVPFVGGLAERTLIWQEGPVWLRARPDYLWDAVSYQVWDLKCTSTSAEPSTWIRRRLFDSHYYLQAAFQTRAVKRLFDQPADFAFVIAETDPPYAVATVGLDPEAMGFAQHQVDEAIELWRTCLESGRWPGYRQHCAFAEVPAWIKAAALERDYWRAS